MSEYEYYEFRTVNRTLSREARKLLEERSSRATVTARRFSIVYNDGGSLSSPLELLADFFDAYILITNYAHYRFAISLPSQHIDESALRPYLHADALTIKRYPNGVVICWTWDGEGSQWVEGEGCMDEVLGIRQEILDGDLRPLFLGWLCGYLADQRDGETPVWSPPPVRGLDALTASQQGLCQLMNISARDLRDHTPDEGPEADEGADTGRGEMSWDELAEVISTMSTTHQRDWLLRFVENDPTETQTAFLEWLRRSEHSAQPPLITAGDIDLPDTLYEELVEQATMDCYSVEEAIEGFSATLDEMVTFPFETWVLGSPVYVTEIRHLEGRLAAVCVDEAEREVMVPLSALPLPDPPPAGASWLAAWVKWSERL